MVIPLSLLRAVDLRTETHALLTRAKVEAELVLSSDELQYEIMQLINETASLPNLGVVAREKIARAAEFMTKGRPALALSAVNEALLNRIPPTT